VWSATFLHGFVIGLDGAGYTKHWDGVRWLPSQTGWANLGAVVGAGSPKIVSWGDDRLDLFHIGRDSAVYHKAWNGRDWFPSLTGWDNLGGSARI